MKSDLKIIEIQFICLFLQDSEDENIVGSSDDEEDDNDIVVESAKVCAFKYPFCVSNFSASLFVMSICSTAPLQDAEQEQEVSFTFEMY